MTLTQVRQSEATCLSSQALICPISRDQFLQVAQQVPTIILTLATVLAERNRALEEELRLTTLPAEARLGAVLLALTERFGHQAEAGWTSLNLELKQEELDSLATTTRVNTTQTLSVWRELGLIEGTRGNYRIQVRQLRERIKQLEEKN